MKRIGTTLTIAIASAAIAAVASAIPASSQEARTELHLYETSDGFAKFIDRGKQGPSAGDKQLENLPVFDQASNERVGQTITEITFMRGPADNPLIFIDCEVQLDDGSAIVFAGAGRFAEVIEGVKLGVTGGTGTYADVSGTITITAQANGRFDFDFDLKL